MEVITIKIGDGMVVFATDLLKDVLPVGLGADKLALRDYSLWANSVLDDHSGRVLIVALQLPLQGVLEDLDDLLWVKNVAEAEPEDDAVESFLDHVAHVSLENLVALCHFDCLHRLGGFQDGFSASIGSPHLFEMLR